ncbi:methyltransferase [Glaciecola sp. 1036]|uniref:methyltransferase n=1 Tax=Alteromonadaceae TaxID=72275 RepID=UPI003D0814B6
MSKTSVEIAGKQLVLSRFPVTRDNSLQAWDSADELLIDHINNEIDQNDLQNMLIFNDDFGALTCYFAEFQPTFVSDSFMSHCGTKKNLAQNNIQQEIAFCDVLNFESYCKNKPKLVVIKIPRTLALLEQILISLSPLLTESTQIIGAAKTKMVTNSVLKLFERHIGKTNTSLAVKKSRLIFAQPALLTHKESPYPTVVNDPDICFELYNHANVFCRDQLDIGARFLLKHFPKNHQNTSAKVIDLGCGNGVLGTAFSLLNPECELTFVDESFMAVASAKLTFEKACKNRQANFVVSHCLSSLPSSDKGNIDLVLCNPPFHQQNTITDEIAWSMFSDAYKFLKIGGELRIVANRHLDYMSKLRKLFGGAKVITSNKKFTILSATRRN